MDVVVNGANVELRIGGGVVGAISPRRRLESRRGVPSFAPIRRGQAVVTGARPQPLCDPLSRTGLRTQRAGRQITRCPFPHGTLSGERSGIASNVHPAILFNASSPTSASYAGSVNGPFEVHHVRRLADLDRPRRREKSISGQSEWHHASAKNLVTCSRCHQDIHRDRSGWGEKTRHWKDG